MKAEQSAIDSRIAASGGDSRIRTVSLTPKFAARSRKLSADTSQERPAIVSDHSGSIRCRAPRNLIAWSRRLLPDKRPMEISVLAGVGDDVLANLSTSTPFSIRHTPLGRIVLNSLSSSIPTAATPVYQRSDRRVMVWKYNRFKRAAKPVWKRPPWVETMSLRR